MRPSPYELKPTMDLRLELATGRLCEFIERTTGKQLDEAQLVALRDIVEWELAMSCAVGIKYAQ